MLPKGKRVGKQLFSLIFKEGVAFHSPHLSLKVIKDGREGRFSAVVGKNASRQAVLRNEMRRKGYALLLKHLPVWPKGASGILFIKKKAPLRLLEDELLLLLRRAKLK